MANKKDKKKKDCLEKTEYGDIVKNTKLIKRTLMVSAFPALVKESEKNGKTYYDGFLPGFEFSEVKGAVEIGECMEQLQDLLDDCVEELIVFEKQLPNLPEDEELLEQNPGYVVRYLDINVYAEPEEMGCSCDCDDCSSHHHCDCGCEDDCDDDCDCGCSCDDDYDCDDDDECSCGCGCGPDCDCGCQEGKECTCTDDNCNCGCHDHCDCGDEDCDCDDDCDCGCKDGKECTCEHDHKEHKCHCHEDKEHKDCKCKNKKKN